MTDTTVPTAAPSTSAGRASARRVLAGQVAVVAATILVLAGACEFGARRHFTESDESTLPCLNLSDPVSGVTARPGSACRQKMFESALVDYRFDACGHRSAGDCRVPPAPPARRIVMVGSSLVEGFGVPVEAAFGSRLGPALAQRTRQPVEVYNEGMQWGVPRSVALRLQEVLDARPDLVLWPVTPFDVQHASLRLPYIPGRQPEDSDDARAAATPPPAAPPATALGRLRADYDRRGGAAGLVQAAVDKALAPLRDSRAVFAARHVLFEDQQQYVKHLEGNAQASDYLRDGPGGVDVAAFEKYYAVVSDKLRAAGIPLVVTLLPSHAQVDLLSGAASGFPELDATGLDKTLRAFVESRGDDYVDVFGAFAHVDDPGRYFYAVDEHMNEDGHALLANVLADALGADPAVRARIAGGGKGR